MPRRLSRLETLGFLSIFLASAWKHEAVVAEKPAILLPLLLLALAVPLLMRGLDRQPKPETRDPFEALEGGRGRAFLLALSFVALFFVDVGFAGRTTISAPWFNMSGEALDAGAGFDHLIDAWAGFLIEGPAIYLSASSLAAGEIPYWNPHEACGVAFAANGETGVFSLIQLPLNLAPSLLAWDLFALARIVLALYFATLLGRGLGTTWRSALFLGTSFALSGVFTLFANLVHLNSALFLPLVLLTLEALLHRPSWNRAVLFTTALAFALNGGNPQPVFALGLLYLPRMVVFLFDATAERERATVLALFSGLLAVLINALPLLSMSELLGRSANRTLFDIGPGTDKIDILAFASPLLPVDGQSYGIVHAPQFWFIGSLALALVLAGFVLAIVRRRAAHRGLALGLVLFAALLATDFQKLFAEIPVLGGLQWTKYVAAAQLLGLILAARTLDELVRKDRGARLTFAAAALLLAGLTVLRGFDGPESYGLIRILAFLVPSSLFLLSAGPVARRLSLPLIVCLLELGLYLPQHPQRPVEPRERWPEALEHLSEEQPADDWVDMTYRRAAFKDAASPMLSGLLGWQDFRSVTPLPSLAYHRFMSPWINCGPWPPYLLLGASREIMLAPVFDHVGVEYLVLREDDFQSVVRTQRADLLEDEPVIRFGELQRSLRYGGLDSGGLLNLFPYEGACLIAPGRELVARFDLAAAEARIALRVESDRPFEARLEFAGRSFRLDAENPEARVEIAEAWNPVDFAIELKSTGPARVVFSEWWVKRHISKGRYDFDDRSDAAVLASGHRVLQNRHPLPIARTVERPRLIAEEEEFWSMHRRFAATGEGWDPRRESFILVEEDADHLGTEAPPLATNEKLALKRRGFNQMRIEADLASDRWVLLAVAHDPGWRARQDGRELPIRKADGAFMAVRLEAGNDIEVDFRYRPLHFERNRLLGIAGFVGLLALGLLGRVFALRERRTRL